MTAAPLPSMRAGSARRGHMPPLRIASCLLPIPGRGPPPSCTARALHTSHAPRMLRRDGAALGERIDGSARAVPGAGLARAKAAGRLRYSASRGARQYPAPRQGPSIYPAGPGGPSTSRTAAGPVNVSRGARARARRPPLLPWARACSPYPPLDLKAIFQTDPGAAVFRAAAGTSWALRAESRPPSPVFRPRRTSLAPRRARGTLEACIRGEARSADLRRASGGRPG